MLYSVLPLAITDKTLRTDQLLLDIETTGLSKQTDIILTIGLLVQSQGSMYYHSWLCETSDDERFVLQAFLEYLCPEHKLYTFGGTHFDLVFILEKSLGYDLDTSLFEKLTKIDIKKTPFLKLLTPNHSVKRQTLENFLHFSRSTSTDGRNLAKIGTFYLNTQNTAYKALLLGHQQDDLLSLLHIMYFGTFLGALNPSNFLEAFRTEESLSLCFQQVVAYAFPVNLTLGDYQITYTPGQNLLKVSIAFIHTTLKQPLPYKDYYHVNGELIHRSLAQFIPNTHKQKATKTSAFIRQENTFLPLDTPDAQWFDAKGKSYILADTYGDYIDLYVKTISKKITRGIS